MKKLLLLLLAFVYSFSLEFKQDFLEPEDAFKTSFTKNEDSLNFKLDLGDSIYLYDDKLQVFITKPQSINITEDVNIVEPVTYEEFIVHFTNQSIDIPFALLKSKVDSNEFEVVVKFQGCAKAGLCYAPMSEKYTLTLDGIVTKETKAVESKTVEVVEENKQSTVSQDTNLN